MSVNAAHLLLYFIFALGGAGIYFLLPRGDRPKVVVGAILGLSAVIALIIVLATQVMSSGPAGAYFYVFATIALVAAARVITHPKPVYSAIYFVLVVVAVAALLVLLHAEFVAIALIIIYAGAIMVTYLFVIMLARQPGSPIYDRRAREPFLGRHSTRGRERGFPQQLHLYPHCGCFAVSILVLRRPRPCIRGHEGGGNLLRPLQRIDQQILVRRGGRDPDRGRPRKRHQAEAEVGIRVVRHFDEIDVEEGLDMVDRFANGGLFGVLPPGPAVEATEVVGRHAVFELEGDGESGTAAVVDRFGCAEEIHGQRIIDRSGCHLG